MLDRERKRVPDQKSITLKDFYTVIVWEVGLRAQHRTLCTSVDCFQDV